MGAPGKFVSMLVASLLATFASAGPSRPPSDHFDGRRFFNPEGGRVGGDVASVIKWGLTREAPEWDRVAVHPVRPPRSVDGDSIVVTWIGHATLLIQWAGRNILTDPIWSDRASPLSWVGPKRYADPAIAFEDLPLIHAVVISHNHYDHLDEATILRLEAAHRPIFFVPVGQRRWFEDREVEQVVELDWWQSNPLAPLTVHCVPVKHFSGRSPFDRDRTLWCGWVMEGPGGNVFFAGDTGYTSSFAEIGRRFGPIRLAALPIGAYEPRWFMAPVHMNPAEAVQAHLDLGAITSMGIHFNTFRLTDEPQDEPPRAAREELLKKNVDLGSFWTPQHGESRRIEPLHGQGAAVEPTTRATMAP
ncbi:MAG: MBL fold metallo-hydrolase [Nitrospirae bacterium]|nr:MBL fold metallo-hydrolase [Nitrospirota bacterium]